MIKYRSAEPDEAQNSLRFMFFSDTHLGFDEPMRPRVERRRRGDDFFANYLRILEFAEEARVDFLVHGGDVFYRSKIPEELVWRTFQPLFKLADKGVPIYIVPGNHERGEIPHELLASHQNIHIFREPGTFLFQKNGMKISLSGFPYHRDNVRDHFSNQLAATAWQQTPAALRLLCVHHAIEGARVGPVDYTFRRSTDTIQMSDIPSGFDAVLAGHIHRHQVLTKNLAGRPIQPWVFFPGSIERTAFAEMYEPKGFIHFGVSSGTLSWNFHELPSRPMRLLEIDTNRYSHKHMDRMIRSFVAECPEDAVIKLRFRGNRYPVHFNSEYFRNMIPESMNLELRVPRKRRNLFPNTSAQEATM